MIWGSSQIEMYPMFNVILITSPYNAGIAAQWSKRLHPILRGPISNPSNVMIYHHEIVVSVPGSSENVWLSKLMPVSIHVQILDWSWSVDKNDGVHWGGKGNLKIAWFCRQTVLIGCVKCGRRGGGVQNPEICSDILNGYGFWLLQVLLDHCLRPLDRRNN